LYWVDPLGLCSKKNSNSPFLNSPNASLYSPNSCDTTDVDVYGKAGIEAGVHFLLAGYQDGADSYLVDNQLCMARTQCITLGPGVLLKANVGKGDATLFYP